MNKNDFVKRVVMAVEFVDDDGYRFWEKAVGTDNVQKLMDEKAKLGYGISDVDYCCNQDDDIRELLDKAYDIFRADKGSKFETLDDAIESLLTEEKPKKVWTEKEIKELVQTNDKVLYGALKKLYDCQTEDEKCGRHTNETNGKGFNKFDAEFLSSVAEFLIKTGFLTEKQKVITRKKLVKYNKQLTKLANATA